jgi:hypothetical protein
MKNKEKILMFRNFLAEQGQEFTLEQAKKIYEESLKLLKRSRKMSQLDLWKMQEVEIEGMTEAEKQNAITLYQHIRELS